MAASEHKPVLIVIAGPNGSGKTSVTTKILHHEWLEDSEYINPDNVARDVFGDWNNHESVLKAANYCNEWRERCLAERKSHIFETVMSGRLHSQSEASRILHPCVLCFHRISYNQCNARCKPCA